MIFLKFILMFILCEAIVFLIRFFLRKKEIKLWLDIIITVLEFFLSIVIALFVMTSPMKYAWSHFFLFAMYVVTMMDSLGKLITLVVNKIKKQNNKWILNTIISFCLGVIYLIFGIINMEVVKPKYISINSNKITKEVKIAFISDMHIGSSQPASVSIKTINKIKAENPDYIFLGGDIIDGYTKKEDMLQVINTFKDCTAKVYFIYGNHDPELNFTLSEYEEALINNNITIVKDEFIKLNDELVLLGRFDHDLEGRKDVSELANPYNGYVIVVDHQPFYFEDNCKLGIDLQLSGHTHAGQLFPLRMIYGLAVYSYGMYTYEDAILNVSSGASGWKAPFRTEVGSQYEIITIKPTN